LLIRLANGVVQKALKGSAVKRPSKITFPGIPGTMKKKSVGVSSCDTIYYLLILNCF
jgi:hypothetical protein